MVELSVKPLKKVDVVSVVGRVDSANVGELEVALKGLQDRGRHKLVLDFEKLDYISSGGLRAMVAALKTARTAMAMSSSSNPTTGFETRSAWLAFNRCLCNTMTCLMPLMLFRFLVPFIAF